MPDLPRLRIHPALGVAIQLRPGEHWWLAVPPRMEPTQKMTDEFVHAAGWRELWVMEQYSGKGLITAEQAEQAARAIMAKMGQTWNEPACDGGDKP